MNRRRLIPVLLLVALVAAALATRGFGLLGTKQEGPFTLHGNVDIREVDLAFRVPGRIASIAVDEGQKVKAGQELAVLDAATIEARIGEASARVEQARAQLLKAERGSRPQEIGQARARTTAAAAALRAAEQQYRRRAPLVAPGAISRAVWDQTVAERARARAQLAEAEQGLSLARAGNRPEDIAAAGAELRAAEAARNSASTDLADTRLAAPVDAVVATRAQEPGAIVQGGQTVLTLAINRPLRVRAYVSEPDLSRIGPGMAVEVNADGNPRTYRGTVGWISPKAEFTPRSVETENLRTDLVYRVRIIVDRPDDALRQGQPVTIRIPAARPAHRD
ncbi:MAG: HlyD family efflux transporter periplasmic adaptor subunit [Alphaproteobacteria bacterium]|nr:HlyD family efflux transporter periplasmic adaptor subunit [Alphaproteobacteria bacterium]MBV9372201.1 HlyD family efflux transporter periplasmic adaptor subunit [Alphaproteobacteria bacterium]MBV9902332.1 HlyD family efflux transporter periplasmic adaptor subunit [Alphaproteobacteria bacterium]